MDEAITLQPREGGHLPAFLWGRYYVKVSQEHVGLQAAVCALDGEQVAVLSHNFMLDKAGVEQPGKD